MYNEYTHQRELVKGSEIKVKTRLSIYPEEKKVFVTRDINKNERIVTKVNEYSLIEVEEKADYSLFKAVDLINRQYVELTIAKDLAFFGVSTNCNSHHCNESLAYYK